METFTFEELLPTYNDWKELFLNTNIVNYNNENEQNFDKYFYNILFRHFCKSYIRYTEPDAFKNELINVYQNKFKQAMREFEMCNTIYGLTEEEILTIGKAITNLANNPNEVIVNPVNQLEYISQQNASYSFSGKLESYLNYLNSLPTFNVYKFINSTTSLEMGFNDLFMVVLPKNIYLY